MVARYCVFCNFLTLQHLFVFLCTCITYVLCQTSHPFTITPSSLPSINLNDILNIKVSKKEPFLAEDLFDVLLERKVWSRYVPFSSKDRHFADTGIPIVLNYTPNAIPASEFTLHVKTSLEMYNKTFTLMYKPNRISNGVSILTGRLELLAKPEAPQLSYIPMRPREGDRVNATCHTTFRGLPPRTLALELEAAEMEDPIISESKTSITQFFRVNWKTDGQTLICTLGDDHQQSEILFVEYVPQKFRMNVRKGDSRENFLLEDMNKFQDLLPGDSVVCSANGRPEPLVAWIPSQESVDERIMEDVKRSAPYFDRVVDIKSQRNQLTIRQNITECFDEVTRKDANKREFLFVVQCQAINSMALNGIRKSFTFIVKEPAVISNASVQIIVISILCVVLFLAIIGIVCCCCIRRSLASSKNDRNYPYAAVNKPPNAGNNAHVEPSLNSVKTVINPPQPPAPPSSNHEFVYATLASDPGPPPKKVIATPRQDVIYSTPVGTMEPVSASAPPPSSAVAVPLLGREGVTFEGQKTNVPFTTRRSSPPLKNPSPPLFTQDNHNLNNVIVGNSPYYTCDGEPIPTEV